MKTTREFIAIGQTKIVDLRKVTAFVNKRGYRGEMPENALTACDLCALQILCILGRDDVPTCRPNDREDGIPAYFLNSH